MNQIKIICEVFFGSQTLAFLRLKTFAESPNIAAEMQHLLHLEYAVHLQYICSAQPKSQRLVGLENLLRIRLFIYLFISQFISCNGDSYLQLPISITNLAISIDQLAVIVINAVNRAKFTLNINMTSVNMSMNLVNSDMISVTVLEIP